MELEIKAMSDSTTQVDQKTTDKEMTAIETSLNNAIQDPFNFGEKQKFAVLSNAEFRLDNGGSRKGVGHWEIQRNGVSGKTTVSQVKAPDCLQDILNQIGNQSVQSKYHVIICNKLKESLNSQTAQNGRHSIRKAYIRFEDLKNLF